MSSFVVFMNSESQFSAFTSQNSFHPQIFFFFKVSKSKLHFILYLFLGQGRIDGPFCNFTKEERLTYLKRAYQSGVRNFEMEASLFAAVCNQAEVPSFVVCVTLLNRLEGDQVTIPHDQLHEFEERPFEIVASFIDSCIKEA